MITFSVSVRPELPDPVPVDTVVVSDDDEVVVTVDVVIGVTVVVVDAIVRGVVVVKPVGVVVVSTATDRATDAAVTGPVLTTVV